MTTLAKTPGLHTTQTRLRFAVKNIYATTLLALVMTGCGGSGSSTPGPAPVPTPPPPTSGLLPSTQYAQQCAANGTGSAQSERQWVRSYVDEAYLWYNEVPNLNPVTATSTPQNFFQALTREGLPAGKDKFSFTFDTVKWNDLITSGTQASYGVQWALISPTVPRLLRVAFSEPNTPAALVGLQRGATVLAINDVDINTTTQTNIDILNNGIFPKAPGVTTKFLVRDAGATATRTIQLTSATLSSTPVLGVRSGVVSGVNFGYILFNDHIATAEKQLIDAVNQLKTQGIQELVLDLRYNGGGYLYIASQLGYMLSSPAVVGRAFEKLRYNSKRVAENNAAPFPFLTRQSISGSNGLPINFDGAPLPQLGLSRVYVITTADTCSASEAIMNGLRPFVNVVQIGGSTCGKPYGFVDKDNCGTSYFPIEFEGVNDLNQGGYSNGFIPNTIFIGCTVSDDYDRQLGDTTERMFAAAITHRITGSCPAVVARKESATPEAKVLLRDPVRENKFLLPRN